MKHYRIDQNPFDKKYYVIGYAGFNSRGKAQYIPVSSGFDNRTAAQSYMLKQYKADQAAKIELGAI